MALRLPAGAKTRLKRRFLPSDPMSKVFDWADGEGELELQSFGLRVAGTAAVALLSDVDGARSLHECGLAAPSALLTCEARKDRVDD